MTDTTTILPVIDSVTVTGEFAHGAIRSTWVLDIIDAGGGYVCGTTDHGQHMWINVGTGEARLYSMECVSGVADIIGTSKVSAAALLKARRDSWNGAVQAQRVAYREGRCLIPA